MLKPTRLFASLKDPKKLRQMGKESLRVAIAIVAIYLAAKGIQKLRNYQPKFEYSWKELKLDAKTDSAITALAAKYHIPKNTLHNFHANHAGFSVLSRLNADSVDAWNIDSSLTRQPPKKDEEKSWKNWYDDIEGDLHLKIYKYWHSERDSLGFMRLDSAYQDGIGKMRREKYEKWNKWWKKIF